MTVAFDRFRFVGFPHPERQFEDQTRHLAIRDGLPETVVVRDAVFVPPHTRDDGSPGGLFGPDGQPIEAAWHRRHERPVFGHVVPTPWPECAATIDEPVLYLGRWFAHFGHALLEGPARCWALRSHPDHRVLFSHLDRVPASPPHRLLLHGLGLRPERFVFADRPTRLRHVIVPRAALEYDGDVFPELRATYLAAGERLRTGPDTETDQPLYLSRSGLPRHARRSLDEPGFEAALERAGFRIFHPERADLRTQASIVHRHRHVFGLKGTAFRLAYFSPREKLQCRFMDSFPAASVLTDAWMTAGESWHVNAAARDSLASSGSGYRSLLRLDVDRMLAFLREEGFVPGEITASPSLPDDTHRVEAAYVHAHELADSEPKPLADWLTSLDARTRARIEPTARVAAADAALRRGCPRALDLALATDREDPHALGALGRARQSVGDPEAATTLREAVALGNLAPDVVLALAELAPEDARTGAALRKAIDAHPWHAPLRLALAAWAERADSIDEADAALSAREELDDPNALRVARADLAHRRGDPAQAAELLDRALAHDPLDPRALRLASWLWIETGAPREAVRAAQSGVAAIPSGVAEHELLELAQRAARRARRLPARFAAWLRRITVHPLRS